MSRPDNGREAVYSILLAQLLAKAYPDKAQLEGVYERIMTTIHNATLPKPEEAGMFLAEADETLDAVFSLAQVYRQAIKAKDWPPAGPGTSN